MLGKMSDGLRFQHCEGGGGYGRNACSDKLLFDRGHDLAVIDGVGECLALRGKAQRYHGPHEVTASSVAHP